jgi:nicotinamide N-methyltransferase
MSGSSVVGERLLPNMNELDSDLRRSGKKKRPTKSSTVTKGASELTSDEVAKITAKAVKLAFPRECEVVSSSLAPTAQASYYSFVLPNGGTAASKVPSGGQAFNLLCVIARLTCCH